MKDTKIKCNCGCGITLYVTDFGEGQIAIGTENNGRKSFAKFSGAILERADLIKLLTQKNKKK